MKNEAVEKSPNIVQNDIVTPIRDKVVENATTAIFLRTISLNNFKNISDDIAKRMAVELQEKSFMTSDLELTEKQKETLIECVGRLVTDCVKSYKIGIKTDERTKEIVKIVEDEVGKIPEALLSGIGQEVNRGALINAVAVAADAKNPKGNKIELQYSKGAGDITVPTKGVFISTNCIEVISNSIKVTPATNAKDAVSTAETGTGAKK